jgi:uncharacterized protein (TIGR02246 family)
VFIKKIFFAVATLSISFGMLHASEVERQDEREAPVRKAVEAYVDAFNSRNAKALAALWSPEAVYTNPVSGEEVVGREAIEKQFIELFLELKQAKLEVNTQTINFVSPNVAIEQGTAKVVVPEETPELMQYSAVYVKRGDEWLLDRMTEESIPIVISHYERLKDLEWMIGKWVDQDEDTTVTTECNWTRNNNFMTRSFTIQVGEQIQMAGMQIIGWDPLEKRIRSWVFDSDGGFAEGSWKKQGNQWHIHQVGVLPDGRKSSAVNVITYIDDDTCTMQSINRVVDGEILPNIDEVQITKNN